jgi:FAS-associated factor 2
VLSRHQGPSSVGGPTSAPTLAAHLERTLLPRVAPYLARVTAQRTERLRERALRAEQEAAFEAARARDAERAQERMRAAERAKEAERAAAAERLEDERRRAREDGERAALEARRLAWRRYARKALIPAEPAPGQGRGATRVALRMPDGARAVRTFGADASLTSLYAFAAAQLVPTAFRSAEDPASPPEGVQPGEAGVREMVGRVGEEGWWGFRMATAYPRREVRWEAGKRIGEVEGFRGGAQLVVELIEPAGRAEGQEDEYPSEESE